MEKILLSKDWSVKEAGAGTAESVTIPHTVQLENLNVFANKKGIFEYEKVFLFEESDREKNIFLHFDGVMINCEVRWNGQVVCKHFGGYLPFVVNLTGKIDFCAQNILQVSVDNRDDKDTPPGKPTDGLDFLYYGGIYRPVTLLKYAKIYITDPLEDAENGGVRFYSTKKGASYDAEILVHLKNTSGALAQCQVQADILDADKKLVASKAQAVTLPAQKNSAQCGISLQNIGAKEWGIDEPNLYELRVRVVQNGVVLDERVEEIGFRVAEVKPDGFYLNGKKMELFGTNRHQQYPYVGISASENAERREARLLKASGINTLRLAHYPQSPSFLSECDRLGILVIDCVPGWQFWGGAVWQARLKQNLIDMIRRDRNHASCVIFEVTPNETHCMTAKGDAYFRDFVRVARAELPTILLSGDTLGRRNPASIPFDIPHTGNNRVSFWRKWWKKQAERLPLQREYGDWSFGGNNSTSRVARGDGEFKMQVQAWNFQWTYNSTNLQKKLIGALTWEGIDHNRGYFPQEGLSKSGYFDIFRLKKFAYYFLKSQKKPTFKQDIVLFPLILSLKDKTKIPVYSNCQEVKIFAGDKLVAEKTCDCGATVFYNRKEMGAIDEAYWLTAADHIATGEKVCNEAKHTISCLFDGGNCEAMQYPPFTFANLELAGAEEIVLKGYIDGKEVKSVCFKEPQSATALAIDCCDQGIKLCGDDNDFIFVYVQAVDKNGTIDSSFNKDIALEVAGGEAIYTNQIAAEAGIASFLIKANMGTKSLKITATCTNDAEPTLRAEVEYAL